MRSRCALALLWGVFLLCSKLRCFSLPEGLASRLPGRAGFGGAAEVLRRKPGPDGPTVAHFLPVPTQALQWGNGPPGAYRTGLASGVALVAAAANRVQGIDRRLLLAAAALLALAPLPFTPVCDHCVHGVLSGLGDTAVAGFGGAATLASWISSPGCPDATFGGLCVWSNIFFAVLAPVFWVKQRFCEVVLVGLVSVASTVYHTFQIHPALGPLSHWTRCACASDVVLALTMGTVLAARYPHSRLRALPALCGAMVCFIVPCLLPHGHVAEVGYSFLHSAWHGFSALAAYAIVGAPGKSADAAVAQSSAIRKNLVATLMTASHA